MKRSLHATDTVVRATAPAFTFPPLVTPDPAGFIKLEQSASESLCKILSYISKADIRSLTSSANREYFELA
jgi:hypothetical protein